MMGQLKYGPALGTALFCAVAFAASGAAAETVAWRVVGVGPGQTAHMRSRPASRARPVGYVPGGARVTLAGRCSGAWCEIRYLGKKGWVSRGLLASESAEAAEGVPQHVNSSPAPGEAAGLGKEDLSQGGPSAPAPGQEPVQVPDSAVEQTAATVSAAPKTYVIAGLATGSTLELREAPSDGARIIGLVPHDANELEALGPNTGKWRPVRYRGVSGWILGRHVAETGAPGQRFRIAGVSMLESAPVRDYPDANAGVVGSLPSYASGIVAIGSCDGAWCHIRYLGLVGWVERRLLEPIAERRT